MSVSVALVRVLIETVELLGSSGDEVLRSVSFDPLRLRDSNGRVSFAEFERVQCAALELTGDAALGLHMGERAAFVGFDVIGSLIAHAASLRDAIEKYLRFQQILCDGPSSSFHEDEHCARLCFDCNRGNLRAQRFSAELGVVGCLRLVRQFAGPAARVRRACFEHDRPSYGAEYRRIFEGTERFNEPFNGVELDPALLARAPLHADAELAELYELQASRKLARVIGQESFAERVVECLAVRPLPSRPAMDEVARWFGISARSLRRRLSVEGVTYAELLDRALGSVARRMVCDKEQSISSAAYAMGFSDPSAFHRAFKRWTGVTPKQYRERA